MTMRETLDFLAQFKELLMNNNVETVLDLLTTDTCGTPRETGAGPTASLSRDRSNGNWKRLPPSPFTFTT